MVAAVSDRSRNVPALIVLLVSALAMGLLWRAMSSRLQQDEFDRFDFETQLISARVSERMAGNVLMLRGTAGLFSADSKVTRAAWQRYVWELNLDQTPHGVQIVAFSKYIPAPELDRYIASVRSEGYSDFTVQPIGQRAEYSSVHFLEPFSGRNLRAFGYDMFSEPIRRAAMVAARDTGQPVLSRKVRLLQETDTDVQAGVLVYYPVYAGKVLPQTVEQRRNALLGWVYLAFRMNDLMDALLSQQLPEMRLEVFDGESTAADGLLYDSLAGKGAVATPSPNALIKVSRLQLEGRVWTLRYTALPGFAENSRFDAPWLMVWAMVLISLLLFGVTWAFMNTRHRAELIAGGLTASLRKSEERYRSIFSRSRVAALLIDVESRQIVEANDAALVYYGYADVELRNMPLARLMVMDDLALIVSLEAARVGQKDHAFQQHRLKNGEVRDVEVHAGPIELDGRPLLLSLVHDITERRKAEMAVNELNQRYQELLNAASEVSIIATDIEGRVTVFNRGAERMLGYSATDIIGKTSLAAFHDLHEVQSRGRELSTMLGRDVQGFRVFVELPVLNNSEQREWTFVRKDGSRLRVSLSMTPVRATNGAISGYLGVAVDITRLKEAEASLLQAKEAAEQASRAKGAFLATMSHEIRTPMNGVIGMAQLLQRTKLTSEQREFSAVILSSAESLLAIINDILDFSKVEAGKLLIEHMPFDLRTLVGEVLGLFTPQAATRELQIQSSIADDVPLWLSGDPGRLRQILINLLGNAIKFTGSGGVFLDIRCQQRGSDDVRLELTVRDTGIGMSEEVVSGLFSPFYQGDSSVTRKFGGTGLGLSITRGLVELMGGQISVQSTEGVGSIFRVELTFGVANEIPEGIAVPSLIELPANMHVLVVDDTMTNQQVALQMLRKLHVQGVAVANGEEAIRMLAKIPFNLVLMDCQMPVMDGFTATSKIRAGAAGLDKVSVPVIAMTANAVAGDRERCLIAGMNDYLPKPLSLDALAQMLNRWLLPVNASLLSLSHSPDQKTNASLATASGSALLPVFDPVEFLTNCADDRELAKTLIDTALTDFPIQLLKFNEAIEKQDLSALRQQSHTLKGLAAQLSGKQMAAFAKTIEYNARAEQWPSQQACIELEASLQSLIFALKDFRSK